MFYYPALLGSLFQQQHHISRTLITQHLFVFIDELICGAWFNASEEIVPDHIRVITWFAFILCKHTEGVLG